MPTGPPTDRRPTATLSWMFEQIEALEVELGDVESRLADPAVISDPGQLESVGRRHKELEAALAVGRPLRAAGEDLDAARELLESADGEERDQLQLEISSLEEEIARLEGELRVRLLPRDPNAGRTVIVEIRGAEGGEEANLFARDLHDMYQGLATARAWVVEPLGARPSDMGGFTEVVFMVRGKDAWTRLKDEGGVRRQEAHLWHLGEAHPRAGRREGFPVDVAVAFPVAGAGGEGSFSLRRCCSPQDAPRRGT